MAFDEWWNSPSCSAEYGDVARVFLPLVKHLAVSDNELREYLRVVWNEAQAAMKEDASTDTKK